MNFLFFVMSVIFSMIFLLSQASRAELPAPNPDHKVKHYSEVIGWPKGQTPKAPEGFKVEKFAEGFRNPRWMYFGPQGELFVAEAETEPDLKKKIGAKVTGADKSQNMGKSANRITRIVIGKNGFPEKKSTYLKNLKQPFGMLILGNYFYVANTDGLYRFPYKPGEESNTSAGEKILELPAGGYNNHWTRNIIAHPNGSKIYVAVGSGSNVGENGMEHEVRRANILEINPDGSGEKIYAAGLRNPVGMDFSPQSQKLWTAVNERDNLGDDLVPDYITEVKEGAFYGWPYAYMGANEDPRMKGKAPDLVKKTVKPDVLLGSHTASLGLHFYRGSNFPEKYRSGAFVGQRGSWNRSELAGYKVIFVPFKNGKASGPEEDFLTGFVSDVKKRKVFGRPVGVITAPDGSLLVTDDASNTIWRVSAAL